MTANEALSELPSVYQALGTQHAVLKRCKPGTKGFQEQWDRCTKLENRGFELMDIVRAELRKTLDKPNG